MLKKKKKSFRRYCLAEELCNNNWLLDAEEKHASKVNFFFLFIAPDSKEPSKSLVATHVSLLTLFICRFSEFASNLTIKNNFWHLHLT